MKIDWKKPTTLATIGGVLLFIVIILCSTSGLRARHWLKGECGVGMDCTCFSNVIDNRLNNTQVRAFRAFLKSAKRRQTANILEFTDEESARGISAAISLCRPVPPQQQQPAKPAAKKK